MAWAGATKGSSGSSLVPKGRAGVAGVDSGGNVGLSGCAASGVGPNYDGARVGTREKAATRGLGNHSVLEKPRHGGVRVFIRPLIYLGLMCRLDHPHDFSGIFAIFGPFFCNQQVSRGSKLTAL